MIYKQINKFISYQKGKRFRYRSKLNFVPKRSKIEIVINLLINNWRK